MSNHKSMLCIGGPRARERYAVLHGTGFRVPVPERLSVTDPVGDALKVEYFDYHAEVFHTPQGDVSFWVPVGQTPLETITMLLEAYERSQ